MNTRPVGGVGSIRVLLPLLSCCIALYAQHVRGGKRVLVHDLAAELLRLPRAQDGQDYQYWDKILNFIHPQHEPERPPGLDASLHALAEYWRWKSGQDPDRLPDALRARLLEACEAYPEYAADLAHLVPTTSEADQRLLALLERVPEYTGEPSNRERIVQHLSYRIELFRPDLIARARAASEGEGYVEHESDVRTLARLDWERAAPLLQEMMQLNKPRMTALALALLYQHAVQSSTPHAKPLRLRLQAIATDESSPAKARDMAVEALMETEWPGRDDWFLSLLADASLASPSDGVFGFSPLQEPVRRDPDRWIPRVSPLVDSPNPAVRTNAVCILVSFQQDEVRPDAAIPLLPWLFDPDWAPAEDSGARHNLIYSLSRMNLPESIPGLLHVLQHPEEARMFEIRYAADAISQYRYELAVPVLRQLLARDSDQRERLAVAKALLASGTVTLEEKVQAVAAAASQVTIRAGRERLNEADSYRQVSGIEGQVILGLAVIETEGEHPALIKALRRRSEQLLARDPATADALDAILAILPDTERDARLVSAIAEGTADAPAVHEAIERRAWLRKAHSERLRALANTNGSAAAIAAVLLQDHERVFQILVGNDIEAQKTLLAALRLSEDMADDEAVAKLADSSDPALAEAAASYWELLSRWRHTL